MINPQPPEWPFNSWLNIEVLMGNTKFKKFGQVSKYVREDMLKAFFENIWPGRPYCEKIIVGFTEATNFGARVTKAKPPAKYAIAVDGFTFVQILTVLNRIFANNPECLEHQSDERSYKSQKFKLPLFVQGEEQPVFLFEGQEEDPNTPLSDNTQRNLHQILIYALCFIIIHESAHICNGHVEYSDKFSSQTANFKNFSKEIMVLELAADAWAVLKNITLICRKLNKKDSKDQFLLFGFAVGVVLLIMEQRENNTSGNRKPGDSNHPSSSQRRIYCKAVCKGFPSGRSQNVKSIRNTVFDGIELAESAWGRMMWDADKSEQPDPDMFCKALALNEKMQELPPQKVFH